MNAMTNTSNGGQPSASNEQRVTTSRMEDIGRYFSSKGFSEEVRQPFLHASRPGTKSAYDSDWEKWDVWCFQREIDLWILY